MTGSIRAAVAEAEAGGGRKNRKEMALNPNHVHEPGHDDGDEESEGIHHVNCVHHNNHIPRAADHRHIASSSSSSSSASSCTATTTTTTNNILLMIT